MKEGCENWGQPRRARLGRRDDVACGRGSCGGKAERGREAVAGEDRPQRGRGTGGLHRK